jgi:hypothetical protein
MAHHCSPAHDWSWFQPYCQSCCCTEFFIVTRVSAHMKWQACPRPTLSISLPHPHLLIHFLPSAEQFKGPLLVMEGRSDYGGVALYQGGKQLTCFSYRAIFPLGSLEDMWILIYKNKNVPHLVSHSVIDNICKLCWVRAVITDQILLAEDHMLVYNKLSQWFGNSMNLQNLKHMRKM